MSTSTVRSRGRCARGVPGWERSRRARTLRPWKDLPNWSCFPRLQRCCWPGIWHGAGHAVHRVRDYLRRVHHDLSAYGRRLWPRTARGDRLLPTPVADCRSRTSASWFAETFFRATGVPEALYLLLTMARMRTARVCRIRAAHFCPALRTSRARAMPLAALAGCFLIVWFTPNTQQILDQQPRDEGGQELQGRPAPMDLEALARLGSGGLAVAAAERASAG